MRIRKTLQPQQDGAKKLLAQYGEQLVCVRYRYDDRQRKRLKTVEIIVEEEPWTPPQQPAPRERVVALRIAVTEGTTRRQVKAAGGTWHPQQQVWQLRYDRVVALGLVSRIVPKAGSYLVTTNLFMALSGGC
jgi:hypothetical protein